MQRITIDRIILTAPAGYQLDLADVMNKVQNAFDKLFYMDSDLNITFDDQNGVIISCSGINEKARVTVSKAWVGDDDCPYGSEQVNEYESEGFIDNYDIKKSLKTAFPGWDIDLDDVTCESPQDINLEDMIYA